MFLTQLDSAFIGLRCTGVAKYAPDSWRFDFEGRTHADIRCPWRIIRNGGIALGHEDHEQQFGLPAPLDGQREALKLLSGKVVKATIREIASDLILVFNDGVYLEVFNDSSGYEGWECSCTNGLFVVAGGGGDLATWNGVPQSPNVP